jgi:hypothetical protein
MPLKTRLKLKLLIFFGEKQRIESPLQYHSRFKAFIYLIYLLTSHRILPLQNAKTFSAGRIKNFVFFLAHSQNGENKIQTSKRAFNLHHSIF